MLVGQPPFDGEDEEELFAGNFSNPKVVGSNPTGDKKISFQLPIPRITNVTFFSYH